MLLTALQYMFNVTQFYIYELLLLLLSWILQLLF